MLVMAKWRDIPMGLTFERLSSVWYIEDEV